MAENDDVDVKVGLTDALTPEAEAAAKSTDEMARQIKQLNRQLLMLDKRATKAALSIGELDAATALYSSRHGQLTKKFEDLNKQVTKYSAATKKAGKETERTGLKMKKAEKDTNLLMKAFKGLGKVALKALTIMKLFGLVLGIGGLIGALGPAVQGTIQWIAALSALSAYLLLVPTLIDVLGLSMLTLMVGIQGVGAALSAAFSGDMTQFNQAIKNLSPEAKKFAKEILKWVPALKTVKGAVQDALFQPINKGLPDLLKRLVPIFKDGMTGLATELGQTLSDVLGFFTSDLGAGSIRTLFGNATNFAKELHRGLLPVMQGFAHLVQAISPEFDRWSKSVGDIGVKFGGWLDKISADGQAAQWIDQAVIMAKQLFGTFKLLGDILLDISKAAGGMSFSPLENLLQVIHDFTSSSEGQNSLVSFFTALRAVFVAISPVVAALASAIGNVLAPILKDMIVQLAPYVVTFINDLADAIKQTAPLWGPLAGSVGQLLIALTPLLPVVAQIVNLTR